jgi:hypothetical protein
MAVYDKFLSAISKLIPSWVDFYAIIPIKVIKWSEIAQEKGLRARQKF